MRSELLIGAQCFPVFCYGLSSCFSLSFHQSLHSLKSALSRSSSSSTYRTMAATNGLSFTFLWFLLAFAVAPIHAQAANNVPAVVSSISKYKLQGFCSTYIANPRWTGVSHTILRTFCSADGLPSYGYLYVSVRSDLSTLSR